MLVAFAVLALFAAAPQLLTGLRDLFVGWGSEASLREVLTLALMLTLATFLIALFALKWRPLRMALTPAATKTRRVRRRAIMLFKTGAERRTVGRTGILIYLSLAEHRAEIVADEAITSVTTPETWGEAMAALLVEVKAGRPGEGIAAAVALIGAVLAEHFPKSSERHQRDPRQVDRAVSRDARSDVAGQVHHRGARRAVGICRACGADPRGGDPGRA